MYKEIWRSVRNYPDYETSNLGRARSLKFGWQRLLNLKTAHSGYYRISLQNRGSIRNTELHIIIAETFLGPRPKDFVCNHKDGIKIHNEVSNLEWISKSEDINHAHKLGLISTQIGFGEKHPRTKFKDGEVWLIKKLLFHRTKQRVIAKMFKVSRSCTAQISAGYAWRHIEYKECK